MHTKPRPPRKHGGDDGRARVRRLEKQRVSAAAHTESPGGPPGPARGRPRRLTRPARPAPGSSRQGTARAGQGSSPPADPARTPRPGLQSPVFHKCMSPARQPLVIAATRRAASSSAISQQRRRSATVKSRIMESGGPPSQIASRRGGQVMTLKWPRPGAGRPRWTKRWTARARSGSGRRHWRRTPAGRAGRAPQDVPGRERLQQATSGPHHPLPTGQSYCPCWQGRTSLPLRLPAAQIHHACRNSLPSPQKKYIR